MTAADDERVYQRLRGPGSIPTARPGTIRRPAPAADHPPAVPCTLYRLYGADGALLYVGISGSPAQRMKDHAHKPWWVEAASASFQHYEYRSHALAAERAAIKSERPKYNIQHNQPTPVSILAELEVEAELLALWGSAPDDDQAERVLDAWAAWRGVSSPSALYHGGVTTHPPDRCN
jgi:hypothetical protein